MTFFDLFTIIGSMATMLYYAHRDIQSDMKAQAARTDKLYEMFIDLLKEKK
jgi:hypothetical protein